MRLKCSYRLTAAVFFLLAATVPKAAMALDLIVEENPTDTSHFSSIQAAINYAENLLTGPTPTTTSFRVRVESGTYGVSSSNPIILINNVPILGRETAKTIITGDGTTGAIIIANNVTNVTIKNFTITNAGIGIDVSNNASLKISNNIFQTGTGSTAAVRVQNSPSTTIVNNTFYQNGTAISRDSDIIITSNIFSTNATAISNPAQAPTDNVTYNDYFNNTVNGITTLDPNSIPNALVTNPDPLFVNAAIGDFHLAGGLSPSPCINAGNPNYSNVFNKDTSDMGAYGGPDADTIPFQISNVVSSPTSSTSVSLSWNPNNSYLVNGYHVYYGTASRVYNGTGATEGNSPVTVALGTTQANLSNLLASAITPTTPTLNQPRPLNQSLDLSWSPSPGATGYKVYYSTSPFDKNTLPSTFKSVDGGGTTSYTLSGLTNEVTYYVAVSAVAQTTYYMAVTAFNDPGGPFEPGIDNEGAYSLEVSQKVGTPQESVISTVRQEFPEAITAYPDLPNKGCFIATAAYGYYSAPQVQALRQFRDRYLVTNAPGRVFVRWYYRYGPIGAAFIDTHPWLKPVVRTALLPAVGGALFMTRTPAIIKAIVLVCIGSLIIVAFLYRKKFVGLRSGGRR